MDDKAKWICDYCAKCAKGKRAKGAIVSYHQNICDVCNFWMSVSEVSDWCHPKVTKKEDLSIILPELRKEYMKMMRECYTKEAEYLAEMIDEYQIKLDKQKEKDA